MALLEPDLKESRDKNRIKQENQSPRGEGLKQPTFTNTLEARDVFDIFAVLVRSFHKFPAMVCIMV